MELPTALDIFTDIWTKQWKALKFGQAENDVTSHPSLNIKFRKGANKSQFKRRPQNNEKNNFPNFKPTFPCFEKLSFSD